MYEMGMDVPPIGLPRFQRDPPKADKFLLRSNGL